MCLNVESKDLNVGVARYLKEHPEGPLTFYKVATKGSAESGIGYRTAFQRELIEPFTKVCDAPVPVHELEGVLGGAYFYVDINVLHLLVNLENARKLATHFSTGVVLEVTVERTDLAAVGTFEYFDDFMPSVGVKAYTVKGEI